MSNAMMSISGGVANLRGGKVAKRATAAKAARADANNEVRVGLSLSLSNPFCHIWWSYPSPATAILRSTTRRASSCLFGANAPHHTST